MSTTTTPFMGLDLPIVGVRTGPLYASDVNEAFDKIDSHNHTSGQGASIPTAGLSIDSDLPINGFNIEDVRSVRLAEQGAALALAGDVGSLSNVNGDLYYNNGAGTPVQITAGAGLNLASLGTIGGDYGQPLVNASVVYSNTTKTFSFTQETNQTAKMFLGDLQLADAATVGANAITVKADATTAAYTTKLPLNLPSAGAVVTVDASGNQDFSEFNSTNFELSGGEFRIKDGGIALIEQASRNVTVGTGITIVSPDLALAPNDSNLSLVVGGPDVDIVTFNFTSTGKPFIVDFKTNVAQICRTLNNNSGLTSAIFELYVNGTVVDFAESGLNNFFVANNLTFSADVNNVLTAFNLPIVRTNQIEKRETLSLLYVGKLPAGTYVIKVSARFTESSTALASCILSRRKLRVFEV